MSLRWTEEQLEDYVKRTSAEGERKRGADRETSSVSAEAPTPSPKEKAFGEDAPETRGQGSEASCAGRGASEDEEQIALFEWAALNMGKYPALALMFHIPNGGGRSRAEAGRFKAMGVKAGVPDIFLPQPCGGFHGLFIELKRANGGRVSREQQDRLDDLNARGYAAAVCHGWEEAVKEIEKYLGNEA